jgi:hypothetical protein
MTMTKPFLKYTQHYRGYWYYRRKGSPTVRLPGIPGSREFMEAYQTALATTTPVAIGKTLRSKPGSISGAIAEYYQSQAFHGLTGGTPAQRRAVLERFREQHGDRTLATLPKEFLIQLFDTMPAHSAKKWRKAIRHFVGWCNDRKLMRHDPTEGIKIKLSKSDGFATWTEDEIATFEAAHPVGS